MQLALWPLIKGLAALPLSFFGIPALKAIWVQLFLDLLNSSPYKILVFVWFCLFVSDPRVKGWLLLENYTPTFIFSVLYLLIVWLGPKYMRNKQPFLCRGILVIYNLGLTLLSLYMFYEVREKGLVRLILQCLF